MYNRVIRGLVPALLGIVLLAIPATHAAAQSDIAGLFAPWQNESRIEFLGDATIESAGHTHHDYSLRLDTYESQGRIELQHEHEINPTIGYQAFYLDINSNSPALPKRLFDGSFGFATPIAKVGDWLRRCRPVWDTRATSR